MHPTCYCWTSTLECKRINSFWIDLHAVAPPEHFHRGGQMEPVKILGWHTKMVLLVATQIQLQSVAVYCIPLDSFSLKRQYASNTFTSSLRNTQTFQKNTKMLLFLLLPLVLTFRQAAHLSAHYLSRLKLQFPIEPAPQSDREIGGSTRGASGVASNSPPPWGHHCLYAIP